MSFRDILRNTDCTTKAMLESNKENDNVWLSNVCIPLGMRSLICFFQRTDPSMKNVTLFENIIFSRSCTVPKCMNFTVLIRTSFAGSFKNEPSPLLQASITQNAWLVLILVVYSVTQYRLPRPLYMEFQWFANLIYLHNYCNT